MREERGVLLLTGWLLALAGGCGDSSGGLDCAWLRSDSCWSRMVEEMRQCAATPRTQGTFNGDGSICSYADGVEVRFDEPRSTKHFALVRAGSQCLKYDDHGETGVAKLRLTTASGTLATDGTLTGFTLTCPDGSSFFSEAPMSLYGCGEGALMPPGMTSVSSGSTNLALKVGPDDEIGLVDCN
jgi:hypothetical protein